MRIWIGRVCVPHVLSAQEAASMIRNTSTGYTKFVLAAFLVLSFTIAAPLMSRPAMAQNPVSEKEAFDSAKELGTSDAWHAFLNAYPKGSRADLARTYLRKLQNTTRAQSQASTPDEATTNEVRPQRVLSTYAASAERHRWQRIDYEMDEGNASAPAAAVSASGLEFLVYCNENKKLAAILRESTRGVYPNFDARIAAGIAAAKGTYGDFDHAHIPMTFKRGGAYSVSAAVQELTGEVSIGYRAKGGGFRPHGRIAEDLMAKSSFTLSAPPFIATFQLKGSRKAICDVLSQCSTHVKGCRRFQSSSSKRRGPAKKDAQVNRSAARNCRELGMAYIGGRCLAKTRKERKRATEHQDRACPSGMYRNSYGICQPNETGG